MTGRATAKGLFALLFFLALGGACGGGAQSPSLTPFPSRAASTPALPSPAPSTTAPAPARALPDRDLLDLAKRFRGVPANTAMVARNSPYSYNVGDQQRFSLLNLDTPRIVTISATLRRITDHAYFFVEDGSPYTEEALSQIGSDFESLVYPTVHNRFGTEWTPGVDSDPRITVLHANLSGAGGYFSADDEYPVVIVPNSNEREMVYLDAGALGSPGPAYNALLAHELQHLVHWHADPGEESWVNEGLSQVSAEELGGGSDWLSSFLAQPDTQLNYWPPLSESGIHYAASELFCSYLLDHYGGRERAKELLAEQGDGIAGINEYLAQFGTDFGRVFADWVVANYLDTADGAYSHKQVDARTRTVTT
ncbi:MAG: hypothetical protein E6J42_10315, partial [Chloroflexi bacterium]